MPNKSDVITHLQHLIDNSMLSHRHLFMLTFEFPRTSQINIIYKILYINNYERCIGVLWLP